MIAFEVRDMTCGHCVSTITRAVRSADPGAKVTTDLARHLVMVEPTDADAQALQDAIAGAGYTPVQAGAKGVGAAPAAARACCGTCR